MEMVIMMIMAMVGFGFVLRLSLHDWTGRFLISLVAAAFVIIACDMASSQSRTRIADWLSRPDLMLDTAVLLTVDVAFQICMCLLYVKSIGNGLSKTEAVALKVCLWFPGLLIFPVLFALLTELIFALTGADFFFVAWSMAAGILVIAPLTAALFRWIVPERDILVEMLFMISLLIAALGIVATVNGRTAAAGTVSVDWQALIGVTVILLSGLFVGKVYNRYITHKKTSKQP